MKKLLAVDLDGTLLYPKRPLTLMTRANERFLKRWIKEGNEVVLATGRNSMMQPKVEKKLGVSLPLIGCNGGFIMENGTVVFGEPLPKGFCADLFLKEVGKYGIQAWTLMDSSPKDYLYFSDGLFPLLPYFMKIYYFFLFRYREITVMKKDVFFSRLKQDGIYKIMPVFGVTSKKNTKTALEAYYPLYDNYGGKVNLGISESAIEITSKDASKGNAVMKIAQRKGYAREDVWVIGDSGNDISMFKLFPHSFVMGHSAQWIREHAAHVVERVSGIERYYEDQNLLADDAETFEKRKDLPIKPR